MMTEQIEQVMIGKESERSSPSAAVASTSRKEKRKVAKKDKRKQKRKEIAEKERQEQEALLNDPEEQRRIQLEEEKEKERLEKERIEFEERERLFLEDLARRKAREEEEREEEERKKRAILEEEQKDKEQQVADDVEANEDEEWEYVEEGPPEIIWQGNEIIVKKNKVRVKKKKTNQTLDENRPISNPLPPQSEAFSDYKNVSTMLSAQQLLENVAQQTPNFGTEQDKAHCPFHLKTGACRFGARCSRVHFYPDKSCTLLIKNMYNGPGMAWEQDEGLETIAEDPCKWEVPGSGFAWVGVQRISSYSEEEVERSFEEFYDDVHTEFLKFGELVNFKVCRNGSHHLRGNAYVHYKSLESAMLAYHSINGRYFAGKQVSCEFVAVTRWKVAICGEYMKSKLKVCSRGSACNFIHCFRNPGGDYEWADWDKPPPRYWVEKMTALFGYSDQVEDDKRIWDPIRRLAGDNERYCNQRSQSKENKNSNRSSRDHYDEENIQRAKIWRTNIDKRRVEGLDRRSSREETHSRHHHQPSKKISYDSESDTDLFNRDRDSDILWSRTRKHSRYTRKRSYDSQETRSSGSHEDAGLGTASSKRRKERHMEEHREKSSGRKAGVVDNLEHKKRSSDSTNSSKGKTYEDRDPASIDDLWLRRSCDFDSTSELSDGVTERSHEYRRKSSTESHKISYDNRESEQVNSEKEFIQKRNNSSRKGVEVVSIDEHKRSDVEEHVNRNSSQSDRKSESYDSEYSCGSVKTGSRKSKEDPPKKSKRKSSSSSDEKFVYDHTSTRNCRDDTGINLDEDIDQRGRWESEHVDSEKEHKRRRKSHGKDDKHHNGSRSRYRSSDEERRSRSSTKSSHRKHRNSSKEMN